MENLNSGAGLYAQYNWYKNTFPAVVQQAADEFFLPGFKFGLLGISKNVNPLQEKDSYFVTKVCIDKLHEMFFRSSQQAIAIILDRVLGKATKRFDLNRISDLEVKIITAFNDFLFTSLVKFLAPAPPNLKRTNFDVVHLTFLIKDVDEGTVARFIVSLPDELLAPESVVATKKYFSYEDFQQSTIDANVTIGTTKFSVFDLKALAEGDIVVFDNSNLKQVRLQIDDYTKDVNLNPNMGLVLPVDDNEGEVSMGDNQVNVNLWDSIEVEMSAQFDAVKVTLGDLKKIESGMVVDLTSIYDNKVTLSVENKPIARGELVIVNDRYGVKVEEVIANSKSVVNSDSSSEAQELPQPQEGQFSGDGSQGDAVPTQDGGGEEFDYSDFELEDDI